MGSEATPFDFRAFFLGPKAGKENPAAVPGKEKAAAAQPREAVKNGFDLTAFSSVLVQRPNLMR